MDLALPPSYARLAELVLPEIRALPAGARAGAIRCSLVEPFGVVELIALAIALLGATVSVVTSAVVVALLALRRTRRSLRERALRSAA